MVSFRESIFYLSVITIIFKLSFKHRLTQLIFRYNLRTIQYTIFYYILNINIQNLASIVYAKALYDSQMIIILFFSRKILLCFSGQMLIFFSSPVSLIPLGRFSSPYFSNPRNEPSPISDVSSIQGWANWKKLFTLATFSCSMWGINIVFLLEWDCSTLILALSLIE